MTIHADVSDTTIEKLRKLMAHEASAREIGSVLEAEAFAAKIQELLIKNHLEMDDIQAAPETVQADIDQEFIKDPTYPSKRTRVAWEERLAHYVSRAYFCRNLVQARSNNVWMVGRPEDRAVASYMFVMLRRLITEVSLKEYSKYFDRCQVEGHVEDARGFRASFINAAVSALGTRFTAMRNSANQSSTGTALVLANADSAVELFMTRNFGQKASGVRGQQTTNVAGYSSGREFGNSVSLNSNGLGGGSGTARKELR